MPGLFFQSGIDKGFENDLKRMNRQMNALSRNVQKQGSVIDKTFKDIASTVAGFVSVAAVGAAGKEIINFTIDLETALTEVSTISSVIAEDMEEYKTALVEMSTEEELGAQGAINLTEALYDIVSAGFDGAEGLGILKDAGLAATAGFVDTAIAADGITTVLNAWGKSASEAGAVSDIFFTTVKKGKTTFPELGKNIAKVAPIAASMGISFEETSAAIASITAAGTKTPEALTQIRAAMISVNKVLGDGFAEANSFQEALQLVADQAGGSQNKLKELLGTDEAVLAVLALTGDNARKAADDLDAMSDSLGATAESAALVTDTTAHRIAILKNNILAALEPLGTDAAGVIGELAKTLSAAFASGDAQKFANVLLQLSKAFVVYKVSVIALNQVQKLRRGIILNNIKAMRLSAATGKTVTAGNLVMAKSFKALSTAFKANPIGILVTGLTLAIPLIDSFIGSSDELSASQKVAAEFTEKSAKQLAAETAELGSLFLQLEETNIGSKERAKLITTINSKYGTTLSNLEDEAKFLKQIDGAYTSILNGIKRKIALQTQEITLVKLIKEENEARKQSSIIQENITRDFKFQSRESVLNSARYKVLSARVKEYTKTIEDLQKAQKDLIKSTSETIVELGDEDIKNRPKFIPIDEDELKQFQKDLDNQRKSYDQYTKDVEGLSGERLEIVSEEYKSLTDQGESYLKFLEDLLKVEKNAKKQAIIKEEISIVQFDTTIKDQKNAQKTFDDSEKDLKELLALYETYNNRRITIEKNYQKIISGLRKDGFNEQADEADKARKRELDALDASILSANVKFQEWLKEGLPDIAKAGIKALKDELDKVKLDLSAEGLDPEQVLIYQQKIKELNKLLKKKLGTELTSEQSWKDALEIINGVNELAGNIINSFDGMDASLKNVLVGITNTSSGIIGLISGFNAVGAAVSGLEKASAILAIVGAALQVVSAITSVFKKNEDARKTASEARKQAHIEQLEVIQSQNLEIIKQNALFKEGNELISDDRWGTALAGLEAYNLALEIQKKQQEVLNDFEVFKAGPDDLFKQRGKQLLDLYPDLIKANGTLDAAVIQLILDTEKLSDVQITNLENLLELTNEAELAFSQFGDFISSIFGGIGDEITDAFQIMFETGDDAMTSLEGSFSDMIENFTKQTIEFAFLQPLLNQLNELTRGLGEEFAQGNITAQQLQEQVIAALGGFYGELSDLQPIILQAFADADDLAAAAGFEDAFNDEDLKAIEDADITEPLSRAGQISEAITEETGSELVGRLGAIMLSNQVIAKNTGDALTFAVTNLVYMKQIAANTDFLPEIAENTRKMNDKL